ncbi:MAG: aconitate hydratase [Phycisphaerae bacterium]
MTTRATHDSFGAQTGLKTRGGEVCIFRLNRLAEESHGEIARLPFSIKVLLESLLRNVDGFEVTDEDVITLAKWVAESPALVELPFKPGRVVLQDFTGVPALVDLAALRSAMRRMGGESRLINPQVPCDLVIDHSVQVDAYGSLNAFQINNQRDFERNRERYEFLKWGQQAFDNFRVVPPATGIVHQVNLEYLAQVVMTKPINGGTVAFPDSLVGTDSHTTMINGLGVVGWGVGGIEAEAVMLGQPMYMLTPKVVGFKLSGELPEGATATDLVLTVTQILRKMGVVGQFVEFYGPGLASMSLPDRATIANMAPEYGATMGFFPVDGVTLDYLRMTGRSDDTVDLVERYCKEQGLWREDRSEPRFTRTVELDMSTVEPSLAGPRRPQDRIALAGMKPQWRKDLSTTFAGAKRSPSGGDSGGGVAVAEPPKAAGVKVTYQDETFELKDGAVVIAAITSCTNTSNPSVMLAAGLLARKAVEKGLSAKPWVKTSLAPGSRVVTEYYEKSGLHRYLDQLGFQLVGYGCTTCIGNSGPLPDPISEGIRTGDLVAAAVLSGNRNFEGRINPDVRANYLASPPLVVAYALAGTVDIDLINEPLGTGSDGRPVYLRDIWPSQQEIRETVQRCVTAEQFRSRYADVFTGDEEWRKIKITGKDLYDWEPESTYIQEPPFFVGLQPEPEPVRPITGARCLVMVGDSVTTDHISPAGSIKAQSPAGEYLIEHGVEPKDFNSYGARRGNDRVMTRGTFANIRLRNLLAPGTEGGVTTYLPTGEQMSIFDAAMRYKAARTPLMVLAGKEYGTGSSRDWAAKGTFLLGVRAVIAESYERIHRSNLVGMGVLPLQFREGESRESLGLSGHETFEIKGLDDSLQPRSELTVLARREDGSTLEFAALCRIDTPVEVEYYHHGGILQMVLRRMCKGCA